MTPEEKILWQQALRLRILSARGLCVLRVKNEDVRNNLDEVLRWIRQACEKTSP
jgi:very-short-patch-repair endonuclease